MTKLKGLYQQWNTEQRKLYEPVITALLNIDISTDHALLERNFNTLCSILNVSRWLTRAFVNQVIIDTAAIQETSKNSPIQVHLPTEFQALDSILNGGFRFNTIVELCGQSNSGQTQFISHLLASYVSNFSNANVYVFGSTETTVPSKTSEVFKRRNIDPGVLSQIEFSRIFSLQDLSLSLERLGALLATTENTTALVVVEHFSSIMTNSEWSSSKMKYLVEIMKSLSRLGCCVLIQHIISKSEIMDTNSQRLFEAYWNPTVDLRLYFSKQLNQIEHSVEIIKSRDKISTRSCLIEIA